MTRTGHAYIDRKRRCALPIRARLAFLRETRVFFPNYGALHSHSGVSRPRRTRHVLNDKLTVGRFAFDEFRLSNAREANKDKCDKHGRGFHASYYLLDKNLTVDLLLYFLALSTTIMQRGNEYATYAGHVARLTGYRQMAYHGKSSRKNVALIRTGRGEHIVFAPASDRDRGGGRIIAKCSPAENLFHIVK